MLLSLRSHEVAVAILIMTIPPNYTLTPKISQLLQSIEASREVINSITIPPEIELNIRRQSTLRSSLFSARIEGNDLTLNDLDSTPSKNRKKIEVFNILKALNWIGEKSLKDISLKDIFQIHALVLNGLIEEPNLGKFRSKVSAIFNSAGIAVYMPPPPKQVQPLIEKLFKFINTSNEQFVPIKDAMTNYTLEKIHPFLDGNGRVGRLFLQAVLKKDGYDMKGLLSLEEYLDNHRSAYYFALEDPERDMTGFIEFMLEAIAETAQKAKELVLQKSFDYAEDKEKTKIEDYLLPRRAEILNIIKEHGTVSFDMLHRRFMAINERTLRYDLLQLQKKGLIRKRGATKGVYYEAIH